MISNDILFLGHKLALFSKNMNIFTLTVLINIHSKNCKKESLKSEKLYRKNTNDSICYLEFILSVQYRNSWPFSKYAEFTTSAMLSDQINHSANVKNIANLSCRPLNSYQNLMVLIYSLFLWRFLLIPFTWVCVFVKWFLNCLK